MAEETTLKRFEELEEDFGDVYSRMDSDKGLYDLEAFTLENADDRAIPGAYNVTSSKPRTFADRVAGALGSGKMQITVERNGKTDDRCHAIEQFLSWWYKVIDTWLSVLHHPPLLEILSGQIALRGRIAGVCYPYEHEGFCIPGVLPWDTRYVAYEVGRSGLSLAGYRTTRTKRMIEEEYTTEAAPVTIDAEEAEVSDIWTPDQHEVWAGSTVIHSAAHGLGYTPVIVHECPAAVWHRDSDYLEDSGESVYAALRDIYPEWNRLLSILNTLTMRAFTNSMQFKNPLGPQADLGDGNFQEDNTVYSIDKDASFESMPLNDIKQATMLLQQILDQEITFASLPLMEYGDMSTDETVAQITTKSAKTQSLLKPRRRAIEMFYDDLGWMLLQQVREGNLPNQVKLKGRIMQMPQADLSEEYTIEHALSIVTPQQDIANYALAGAASAFMDSLTILEKIIRADDPTGIIEAKDREDIERLVPKRKLLREALRLLESKDDTEYAEGVLLALELGLNPEALAQGDVEGGSDALQEGQAPVKPNPSMLPRLV